MGLFRSAGFWFMLFVLLLAGNAFYFMSSETPSSLNALFSGIQNEQKPMVVNQVDVYFCPQDKCANQLIERIDMANKSIYIAIYSLTLDEISDALIRAKDRGVEVKVIFDYGQSQNNYSDDEKLFEAGVPIVRMNGSGYMHNKFAVIDGMIVGTGSFNYSANADEKNNENLIFLLNSDLAAKYKSDFDLIWADASKAN